MGVGAAVSQVSEVSDPPGWLPFDQTLPLSPLFPRLPQTFNEGI
jgi:hypothetical protein